MTKRIDGVIRKDLPSNKGILNVLYSNARMGFFNRQTTSRSTTIVERIRISQTRRLRVLA